MGRSADEWYAIGDAALHAGNVPEARHAYGAAVEANPSHANAVYRLAEIARADGDVANALALVQRSLSIQPTHAGAKKLLAKLQTGSPTKAMLDPPPCPPSGAGIAGVVESVQRGVEPYEIRSGSAILLAFRLRTQPGPGQQGQVVAAELAGKHIRGSLDKGDWVELPARWRPGMKLTRVMNLTTCSEVVAYRRVIATVATYLIVTFVALWIVVLFFVVGRELLLTNR